MMSIKRKTNPKNILILLIIVVIIGGGILGYYSWQISKQTITNNKGINNKRINISAGVVPHHLLAEKIIKDFFNYISLKEKPKTIVLLSPDHFNAGNIVGNSFITVQPDTQEFYNLKIDKPLIENLSSKHELIFSNSSLSLDHGITDLMPFVKKYFPNSKIVPLIIPFNIPQEKIQEFTISLNSLAPSKTIVIASVDFSHYLPKNVAEFHDVKSIRVLLNFEKDDFKNLEVDCWQCLYGARLFAKLKDKEKTKIIGYGNSADFLNSQNNSETTSYFSVIFEKENKKIPQVKKERKVKTMLFTGDIMLDRGVEYLMRKNNKFWPFKKISHLSRGIDIVIGNLEGPIVKNPPNFSDKSLKFAFSSEAIDGLSFANFNLFSLANNHTFNVGKLGFEETKEFLQKANINFIGHPINCKENFSIKKDNIFFLAFNKTFPFNCSDEEITEIVKRAKNSNSEKFLIVILHWGEEYQLKSSSSQRKLAHQIIDAGADLIIGTHPHVVQEVEEYKRKLIFYSLGNFIFDQYFSEETQQGLAVGVEIYPAKVIYHLFPIQNHLSQPFLMGREKANGFLEESAKKSSLQLFDQVKNGIIEIER